MLHSKLSFRWIVFVTLLLLGLDSPASIASSSNRTMQGRSLTSEIIANASKPKAPAKKARSKPRYIPGGRGTPTRTAAGTVRGNMCRGDQPPVALIPQIKNAANEISKVEVGTTVSDRPSFAFYVPPVSQRPTGATQPIRFTLYGPDQKIHWSTQLPGNVSGVVSVNLPKTADPMEVDRVYNWVVRVDCNPNDQTERIEVEGWTMRIAPTVELRKQLAQTAPEEVPALYASFGIWHESISSLMELRRQKPNARELVEDWKALMDSANLKIPVAEGR
ncbi:MAG: DUF928 domain-containing protein [Leptolyngbyaceae cyanobacterium bins.59]|nr:DUF928 domain-containing protein [Leptolyngbyaceae cyanobacterium bins.59]